MSDPIQFGDSPTFKPMTDIARKITTDQGNTVYLAGPDAVAKGKAENIGDFLSPDYAEPARSMRQYWNAVKQNHQKRDDIDSVQEAREFVGEKAQELRDEKAKDEPDQDRIDQIKQQLGGS